MGIRLALMGASLAISLSQPSQAATSAHIKQKMQLTLEQVAETYNANYAPADWKKQHWGWDLDSQVSNIRAELEKRDDITLHQFHSLLRGLISSMRDYHVNIRFDWTEHASLPFVVHSAEGRYFIVHIDRNKLSLTSFPFFVGDEILTFGGRPVDEVVQEIRAQTTSNTGVTDQAMAELYLTSRSAARGDIVPRGGIDITGRTGLTGPIKHTHVIWNYSPERVSPEMIPRSLNAGQSILQSVNITGQPELFKSPSFTLPFYGDPTMVPSFGSPFDIGARQSFIPPLGIKIWESKSESIFHAYIYRSGAKLVGYVRIPTYAIPVGELAIAEFAQLMTKMQYTTDALVIDQVNNPGGYLFFGNALISHLTTKVIPTPLNRVKLTQSDAFEAAQTIDAVGTIRNDEDAQRAIGGKTLVGYPVTYQVAQSFGEYSRSLLEDWNAGLNLSRPVHIGVDHIVPAPSGIYSKPILFLINELDFSCGDFVPAILQDATRKGLAKVTIFGTRTAGAGGYVLQNKFLNQMGISSFSVTGSIAERTNDQKPIENLGVTPDIQYDLKAIDYERNFIGYVHAVNSVIQNL